MVHFKIRITNIKLVDSAFFPDFLSPLLSTPSPPSHFPTPQILEKDFEATNPKSLSSITRRLECFSIHSSFKVQSCLESLFNSSHYLAKQTQSTHAHTNTHKHTHTHTLSLMKTHTRTNTHPQ